MSIPSFSAYLLVEQEMPDVTVHRRTDRVLCGKYIYMGSEAVIPLPEIETEVPLAKV